jgi:hypothetical protein
MAEHQTVALIGTAQLVVLAAAVREMELAPLGAQETRLPLLHRKVMLAATEFYNPRHIPLEAAAAHLRQAEMEQIMLA